MTLTVGWRLPDFARALPCAYCEPTPQVRKLRPETGMPPTRALRKVRFRSPRVLQVHRESAVLPPPCCVTLEKSPDLSGPQFLHLESGGGKANSWSQLLDRAPARPPAHAALDSAPSSEQGSIPTLQDRRGWKPPHLQPNGPASRGSAPDSREQTLLGNFWGCHQDKRARLPASEQVAAGWVRTCVSTPKRARTLSLSVTPYGPAHRCPLPSEAPAGPGGAGPAHAERRGVRAAPPPVVRVTWSQAEDIQAPPPLLPPWTPRWPH